MSSRLNNDSPRDMRAIITRIFEQYPDPPTLPARRYNVHDRHAARRAILRKLGPRRAGSSRRGGRTGR